MVSKITEREVAAQIAAELETLIQQGKLPFQKATVEHSVEGRFPDITVWTDYPKKKAFAFWELKSPGLQEDLSGLPEKARRLGVRYVVVWNFQTGEIYEIEAERLQPRKSYPVPLLHSLEEWAAVPKRTAAIKQAYDILEDLARLARGETLLPYQPDRFYFLNILQHAIGKLQPVLQEQIFQSKKDRKTRSSLDAWTIKQGYPTGLADLDALLARHWAYSLGLRLLFYFTVRRYYSGLPDLRQPSEASQPLAELLWDAFAKAEAVDWQAVFTRSPLDELGLPPKAESILQELLDGFHRYDFSQLKEDVIGQIMEGLIPPEERHALGQYFTREDLVDFILGFAAQNPQGYYLDPTCGSGTFLNRLYSRLRWLSGYQAAHGQLLERIWGVDIAHFPAELATINLFRQSPKDLTNFPRIVASDFFDLQPGQEFRFPPLRPTQAKEAKIKVAMPSFHGIVGNFPYIRQELVERQIKGYKRRLVETIARHWFWKDASLFHVKEGIAPAALENCRKEGVHNYHGWLQEEVQQGHIDLRLSGQADMYAYLFFQAAAFLESGGRLGIVTSNAWLDVAYGEELKRFFLRHFKIVAIVASWAEAWFEDAAVNTAFVILERCEDAAERQQHIVRFVKLKKPLAELLPRELILREAERWQKVDALVRQIETAHLQPTHRGPVVQDQPPPEGVRTVETEEFRIRLVPQSYLEKELEEKGPTAKWGLYIRAPQVYFDLLEAAKDKFVPLSQVAEVRFGIKTGVNDFFYLEPLDEPAQTPGTIRVKNARGWIGEIEKACLRPIIKSPKEAKGLLVDPRTLKYRLFLPPISRKENPETALKRDYPLAWRYVLWGEEQRTSKNLSWPQVPSVRKRKVWWLLEEVTYPDGMWPKAFAERFCISQNIPRNKVLCSDRMYEIVLPKKNALVWGLLNSTINILFIENNGRVNLGEGALDNMTYEAAHCPVIDPSLVSSADRRKIIAAYKKLQKKTTLSLSQEVKRKDRRALDEAVLSALGLDPKKYLPRIYQGLVEMVEERLRLPKLRLARIKQEKRLSFDRVKRHVEQEILPRGLRPISSFLPPGKLRMMQVAVTGRPVSWRAFFEQYTLIDADGNEVGVLKGKESHARYAVYLARPELYLLDVPAQALVAEKAVQAYQQYLREIGQELLNRAFDATRQWPQAEQIAREILQSLGLPKLALSAALGG